MVKVKVFDFNTNTTLGDSSPRYFYNVKRSSIFSTKHFYHNETILHIIIDRKTHHRDR